MKGRQLYAAIAIVISMATVAMAEPLKFTCPYCDSKGPHYISKGVRWIDEEGNIHTEANHTRVQCGQCGATIFSGLLVIDTLPDLEYPVLPPFYK